jgi:hypothetical protein
MEGGREVGGRRVGGGVRGSVSVLMGEIIEVRLGLAHDWQQWGGRLLRDLLPSLVLCAVCCVLCAA